MLFKTDVLVVVNVDLVLCAEQARGGERWHRTLGSDHETLAAPDEPAGESA
jgi:hypothetical protein